jgi:hypothetical protein
MVLIFTGSRHIINPEAIPNAIATYCSDAGVESIAITEIVEGGQTGIDTLANRYAQSIGLKPHTFHALWKKYGRRAGPIRNGQMVEYGCEQERAGKDVLVIAIPAPDSVGTWNMVTQARLAGLHVHVYEPSKLA